MYDIEHLGKDKAQQGKNENAVFDACRANPHRHDKDRVTFTLLASGGFQAALRNEDGIVVMLCKVDRHDV